MEPPELLCWKRGNTYSTTAYAITMPVHCDTEYAKFSQGVPRLYKAQKVLADCRRQDFSRSTMKTALRNVLQEKKMIEGDLSMGYICWWGFQPDFLG